MLFRDTIQEYEFDCCSRKMAPRAVGGYIKMLGYLADYLEQNHKITELEEIKGIHIKKFLMEKEKLGRKPSYINDLLKVYKTFFRYCLNEEYHNNVSKPTLERWHHHLVESGNMVKFAKGALWRTFKDEDGYIVQKRVEPDSQEYQEYCEKRWAYLNGSGFDGADKETRKNTWGSMVYNLMPDYGVYYYCPSSILNALGDQAEEIARLVAQVMAERQEAEKENDEL